MRVYFRIEHVIAIRVCMCACAPVRVCVASLTDNFAREAAHSYCSFRCPSVGGLLTSATDPPNRLFVARVHEDTPCPLMTSLAHKGQALSNYPKIKDAGYTNLYFICRNLVNAMNRTRLAYVRGEQRILSSTRPSH